MAAYNIYEAKTAFSSLIEKAEHGEETIIARAGKPVARIVPFESPKPAADDKPKRYRNSFGANYGNWGDMDKWMNEPLSEEEQRAFGMID